MSLIPFKRFNAAAERLARYHFRKLAAQLGPMTAFEAAEINRRACIPRAWIKLAFRVWARGHYIFDEETREIVRRLPDLPHSFAGRTSRP